MCILFLASSVSECIWCFDGVTDYVVSIKILIFWFWCPFWPSDAIYEKPVHKSAVFTLLKVKVSIPHRTGNGEHEIATQFYAYLLYGWKSCLFCALSRWEEMPKMHTHVPLDPWNDISVIFISSSCRIKSYPNMLFFKEPLRFLSCAT